MLVFEKIDRFGDTSPGWRDRMINGASEALRSRQPKVVCVVGRPFAAD